MAERRGPHPGRNGAAIAERGSAPGEEMTLDLSPGSDIADYVVAQTAANVDDRQNTAEAGGAEAKPRAIPKHEKAGQFTDGDVLYRIEATLGRSGVKEALVLTAIAGDDEQLARLKAAMGRFAQELDTIMDNK